MVREKVVSYIKAQGIKPSSISAKTGISPQAISAIVNFRRAIQIDEYCAICAALNVSISFFD